VRHQRRKIRSGAAIRRRPARAYRVARQGFAGRRVLKRLNSAPVGAGKGVKVKITLDVRTFL
jgi:hypothetical protein